MREVTTSNAELVRRAREGDRGAFAALVRRERGACVMAARAIVGDVHEAEDAAQEALAAAYLHLASLRDEARFRPWLMTILTRTALARRRRLARRRTAADLRAVPARPAGGNPRLDALVREVDRLPGKYRVLLSLVYLAGLSYREAAEAAGITEKRVKSRLYDARALLRRRLGDGRD